MREARRIWLTAAAVFAAGLVLIAVELAIPRDFYTGTDSVRSRGPVAHLATGDRLCVPALDIPARTGQVELELSPDRGAMPALDGWIVTGGRSSPVAHVPASGRPGRRKVAFAIPERAARPASV